MRRPGRHPVRDRGAGRLPYVLRPDPKETEPQADPSVPIFSIGTVSKHTGVSAPALRMWEERYGVIEPFRDEYGKRLYSRSQIDDLIWVRDAISRGLTAAEAHRMLATRKETANTPVKGTEDGVRQWVLADHAWLAGLCTATVETVPAALLAYLGVHDTGTSDDAESWLLVSCLRADRPDWFTGSAHQAARRHGERLSSGERVSFTMGADGRQVRETAAPLMVEGEWSATVGLVLAAFDGDGFRELESMRDRILARFAAWKTYARFEELTAPESDETARSA